MKNEEDQSVLQLYMEVLSYFPQVGIPSSNYKLLKGQSKAGLRPLVVLERLQQRKLDKIRRVRVLGTEARANDTVTRVEEEYMKLLNINKSIS